jgi:hypothetical protein
VTSCPRNSGGGARLRVRLLASYAVGVTEQCRPNRGSGSGAGNLGAAVLALLVRRAPSTTGAAAAARNFRVGFSCRASLSLRRNFQATGRVARLDCGCLVPSWELLDTQPHPHLQPRRAATPGLLPLRRAMSIMEELGFSFAIAVAIIAGLKLIALMCDWAFT